MKLVLKRALIVWLIICTLLPTLFSGLAFAADDVYLNQERAGNYAANFAINFYENWSSESVITEDGNSNARASANGEYNFIWPLKEGDYTGSSKFGLRVWDDGSIEYHKGMDFAAPLETPIYSSSDGTVLEVFNGCIHNYPKNHSCGCAGGYGNNVKIETDNGILVVYGHMTYVEESIKTGSHISQGQLIGAVGTTGWSTGAHLHFEFDTNDIQGLESEDYIDRTVSGNGGAIFGYRYSVDPSLYIDDGAKITSVSSKTQKKARIRGQVKTEYDSTINPMEDLDQKTEENYKFNNLSWIGFVYRNSLFTEYSEKNINNVLTGSGSSATINLSDFDDKNSIPGVKEEAQTTNILDISSLVSEGKILPGDILYSQYDGHGEYLLYVGGTKIIYATEDSRDFPSGALKYDYLEYYLRRIRNRLREGHEDDSDFKMPLYGITQVYRIKSETAESLRESNANLIYNGKGYYSVSDYYGIPKAGSVSITGDVSMLNFTWIFNSFAKIINFLVNIMIYMIRMQIIGWANLVENLLQHVVLGISGHNETSIWDSFYGTKGTSASGDRITIESIFFNQIPIIDANFFNFQTAGNRSLEIETTVSGPVKEGEEAVTATIVDDSNIVVKLRKSLVTWYVIIRNASIAILLLVLVYLGIRLAITASSEKKAEYKKLLLSWVTALFIVMFIHLFMYLVFVVNDTLVGICNDFSKNAAQEEVTALINNTSKTQQELNLYDAIRIKAYAFNWKEGLPATIIYIFLIYLFVRFILIYFKRYLTIYILALSGSFMGVKYALEKIAGKKTTSLNKWMKDFAFNVLLQTVHAFLYVLFMAVALSVSQDSIAGAAIALVILNFMLKADKIIIQIFGLDKAGSLAEVNNPEKWKDLFHEFLPIYTITRGAAHLTRGKLFGDYSLFNRIRYWNIERKTGKDNIVDWKKELENRKYIFAGTMARGAAKVGDFVSNAPVLGQIAKVVNRTPIRNLWKYNKYQQKLSKNASPDTNKRYYKAIKEAKKMNRARFTRSIGAVKDLALGTVGMVASAGFGIADPVAGFAMFTQSKKMIDKHRTLNRAQRKTERYGASKSKAKMDMKKSEAKYNNALGLYSSNQLDYEERMQELKDQLASTTVGSMEYYSTQRAINSLEEYRKVEEAKELHAIEQAYEKFYQSKVEYGNAKHEHSILGTIGKFTGASVLGDMAANDAKASYKAWDKAEKQDKKLEDLAKVADLEKEVRELHKQLKAENDRYAAQYANDNGITIDQAKEVLDNQRADTIKEAKKMNIRSSYITAAINEYLYENNVDTITGDDVDGVLIKVQKMLDDSNKDVKLSPEVRFKVKKKLEEKMIKDKKGLGFDTKDATTTIREALGADGVLKSSSTSTITDPTIRNLHEQILQKIKEINTYNEVGKVKYKDSLVNLNKILKDAKKQ